MALTGCGGADLAPADQTVGAIFELTAKSNMAPMKDLLGFASEDDVRSTFLAEGSDSDDLVSQFQEQFTAEGVTMSDESVKEFADALEGMLAKLTYTTEIISEDKEKVVVSLKVNSYSAAELFAAQLRESVGAPLIGARTSGKGYYQQGFGFIQLYTAPNNLTLPTVSAILIGGALVNKATIGNVIIGTILFQGMVTMTPTVMNAMVHMDMSEVIRNIVSNGMILYALTRKQEGTK